MKKRVFINYFDTISCAGDNPDELFSSICEKKDTISLDTNYVKDSVVAIGKIKKEIPLNELLLQRVKKLQKELSLKDFRNTLLVIGSSVGGMSETEMYILKIKTIKI